MKKQVFSIALMLCISFFLLNWGEKGHYKINFASTSFLPKEMSAYKIWKTQLGEHSSDPDKRRNGDPAEGKRHYIDIDNYADFLKSQRIVENFDSAVKLYGNDFVTKNGILPWATMATYNQLVTDLKAKDWKHAVLTASDLGHYVADAHMPLHTTANYDGVSTNQKGIHSRYESKMIDIYIQQIQYDSTDIAPISDVQSFIFSYIYSSFTYRDSLLNADRIAFNDAGLTYSDQYYEYLWKHTHGFTLKLFRNASRNLGKLIYTAWLQAGKPEMKEN